MDDMGLDVPPPPPPADNEPPEPPMDDQTPPEGGDEQTDPIAGGPDDDPMAGDPNALSAGQDGGEGDDITQKYQRLSSDQKHAADKYIDSMLNTDDNNNAAPPQMESRFNFKHIIDEVFGEVQPTRKLDQGITRPGKQIEDSAVTEYPSPFAPGL